MTMNYLSILIAYNDDNITRLLTTIIDTRYNAKVDIVTSAKQFFDHTSAEKYDVIMMGSTFCKDAFNVIRKFRAGDKNSDVPIALFISHLTEEFYMQAVELDVFDFLSQPFSLDHIYLSLDYVLHKKGYQESVNNKRNAVRCDKRLFIKYLKKEEAAEMSAEELMATTENVSVCGAKFSSSASLAAEDEIDLEIMLDNPYDGSNVRTRGVVKWSKQHTANLTTVGVEFLELNSSDRLRLSNILYSH